VTVRGSRGRGLTTEAQRTQRGEDEKNREISILNSLFFLFSVSSVPLWLALFLSEPP
jgi:hypothetical protein